MSGETNKSATISAIPFQFVFLLYCALFGVILRESGLSAMTVWGVVIFLGGLGLLGLQDFREQDAPIAVGGMYLAGVMVSLLLFLVVTSLPLVTAIVLGGLFVGGIAGNIFYFLGENQKLAYLNGQISEEGLTLRRVGRILPLWLVVVGNLLLVFLITPLLFGSVYSVAGPYKIYLFEVKTNPSILVWFVFVLENLSQSLLGIASLLGISFPGEAVEPVAFGRLLVFVFRVGIFTLGFGAIKRYLDLRATTRRLMLALGRSGLEQEQWEFRKEGQRVLHDKEFAEFENRRKMWQLRLRQLVQLYPAQLDYLVSEVAGRGDWRLRLDGKLYPSKDDPLAAEHLGDWIRTELADLLGQGALYEGLPAKRQEVMRTLLQRLEIVEGRSELSPRVRAILGVTLARLLRSSDSEARREQVVACLQSLVQRSERLLESDLPDWPRRMEARNRLASLYALLLLEQRSELVAILPAFQSKGAAISIDVNRYVEDLAERWENIEGSILSTVERLLTAEKGESRAPGMSELSYGLRQLPVDLRPVYQLFVAKTLVAFWFLNQSEGDEDLLQPTARLLILCGEKNAAQAVWRIVQSVTLTDWRERLIKHLVEGRMDSILGSFFRHKLGSKTVGEQTLAAELLTAVPVHPKNSEALRRIVSHNRVAEEVRWRGLCSLATLAQVEYLTFLQELQFSETSTPKLWAAWTYAKACCGEESSLPLLLDTLSQEEKGAATYQGMKEVLADRRPEEVEAICVALDGDAKSEERLEASETLVGCQSALALPILGRLVVDSKTAKKVRQSAAEDLGILGRSLHPDQMGLLGHTKSPAEWSAPPLLHALEQDKDLLVRIRAARALGRLGLSEIRQRFQQALVDSSENAVVRQVVAQAVGEMGDASWMDFLLERFPEEKSAQVRQGMTSALDRLGAETPFFLECLQQSNAKIRQLALQALAHRPMSDEQKRGLLDLLEASHKDVRAATADTLGAQAYAPAIPALCLLTQHEHEPQKAVRRAAISALRRLAGSEEQKAEVRIHLEKVFQEDPDHLVIQDCAYTLAHLYKEEVGPLLLHALQHRDEREPWMKGFAGIVRAIGESAYTGAEEYLYDQLRKALKAEKLNVARIIALMRPTGVASGSRALPLLFEVVQKNSEAFSWVAAQVMAEIGDPQIVEPLRKFMEFKRSSGDLEPNLEAVLLITLVRMGEWDYLEELVAMLRDTSHDNEVARRRALGVLPDLQIDLSALMLIKAMSPQHTPHEKIRETAVKALGRMVANINHQVEALQWQAQSDPRAKIREAAQGALLSVESRTEGSARRFRDRHSFSAVSKLAWDNQPLHPAWQQQWEQRQQNLESVGLTFVVPGEEDFFEFSAEATLPVPAEASPADAKNEPALEEPASETAQPEPSEVTPAAADAVVLSNVAAQPDVASTPVVEPVTEPVVEPVTEPDPPSFEEMMVEALLSEDEPRIRSLAASDDAQRTAPLWKGLLSCLDNLSDLRGRFDSNWVLVLGDSNGAAIAWPFLVMRKPVTQQDYLDFCVATDRPLPRQFSKRAVRQAPDAAITNLKWWDAFAYAEYRGWYIPEHEQLMQLMLTFGNFGVFTLEGERLGWMRYPSHTEWTSTSNASRRQLIRVYNSDTTTPIEHVRRETQSFNQTFRCCVPIDVRRHPAVGAFLDTKSFEVQEWVRYCSRAVGAEFPEDPKEWVEFLTQLTLDETVQPTSDSVEESAVSEPASELETSLLSPEATEPEVQLHDTPAEAPAAEEERLAAERAAEEERLAAERAAEEERLAAERAAAEERLTAERAAEEARLAQELAHQQETRLLWSYLEQGAWREAHAWLQQNGNDHFASAEAIREQLLELCEWLQGQQGMVWVRDQQTHQGEVLLLQGEYVSRRDFHTFCLQNELPMSPRWRGGKRISEPQAPATDLSVRAAREYADSVGAALPSLEQLQYVVQYDFFQRTLHELTSTHYPNNARLYYSFDLTAAHENNTSKRTLRRDEPAAQTGFRVCRTLDVETLPQLLLELIDYLPSAFPVDSFPGLLGPALRVHLSYNL